MPIQKKRVRTLQEEYEDKSPEVHTRLSGKDQSPLVIRRYSTPVLHFVALITDENLDAMDELNRSFWKELDFEDVGIQGWRNIAGSLSQVYSNFYAKTEGCAVVFIADKMIISSLYGDFMNHGQCRLELFQLLNMATQV